MIQYLRTIGAAVLVLSAGSVCRAVNVNVGTIDNAANWTITGAGAVDAPAWQVDNGDSISITDNAVASGAYVPGGSEAAFTGFWKATLTFFLPADAVDVELFFEIFAADDKVVLDLNGTIIGDANVGDNTGLGQFNFGAGDVAYTFTGNGTGTVTTGFILDGINTLCAYVNNTGDADINSETAPFQGEEDGDVAIVGFEGILHYVPEPASAALLGLGGLVALTRRSSAAR